MESQKMMQDMMSKYDKMKSKLENTKEKQFMHLQFMLIIRVRWSIQNSLPAHSNSNC